jgi:hypothetical protein
MNAPAQISTYSRFSHAFGGVWRLTARNFLVPSQALALVALCAAVAVLGNVSSRGHSDRFIEWLSSFYLFFLLPTLTFISSGGTMRDDLKSSVTDYIFTRPLPRALYVAFKYVSHTAVLLLGFSLVLASALVVAKARGMTEVIEHIPLILAVQSLVIVATAGFGFLFGAITNRYVALGLAYAALVEVGIGRIPTQISSLSMLRHARTLLQPLTSDAPSAAAGSSVGMLLMFAALTVAVAAALIHTRELLGDRAKDA